ncbi:MAG: ubiquinone/menaquinone biosynthesis methyltransferase [Spirochaetia bacterium]|nr:ubiquinone/menaquinone biosynthesis methyltransferase [Spirochaetia bacterium]
MKESTLVTSRTESGILPAPEAKAQFVQTNFDQIASNYDSFNDWITFGMHRLWKRKTVLSSGLKGKPGNVLDLCCGSGDLSLAFLKILGQPSSVTAVDFSSNMLGVLGNRLSNLVSTRPELFDGKNVILREGDAMRLDFDQEFDAISMGFGLRNVEDRAPCLAGILRALKPGGKFLLLEVGKPPKILSPFFSFYFEQIVPKIGYLIHGAAHKMYDYLPQSARRYPDQLSMKEELEAAGFTDIKIVNFMFGSSALHIARKPGQIA